MRPNVLEKPLPVEGGPPTALEKIFKVQSRWRLRHSPQCPWLTQGSSLARLDKFGRGCATSAQGKSKVVSGGRDKGKFSKVRT